MTKTVTCSRSELRFQKWYVEVAVGVLFAILFIFPHTSEALPSVADTVRKGVVTTDTGDFAPGWTNYVRYDIPSKCVAAAQLVAAEVLRTAESQRREERLRLTPLKDTLPARAIAVARECGQKFHSSDTLFSGRDAATNLLGWFELSLLEMNDTLANQILMRAINEQAQSKNRINAIREWAVKQYLAAKPARLMAAVSVVTTIDADNATAILPRLRAHSLLLNFARRQFDRASIRREANRMLEVARTATKDDWLRDGLWTSYENGRGSIASLFFQAYSTLMTVAAVDAPDSIPVLVQALRKDYNAPPVRSFFRICEASLSAGVGCGSNPQLADIATWNENTLLQRYLISGVQALVLGQHTIQSLGPVHRVITPFFYSVAAEDSVVPVPGKVSLLLLLPKDQSALGESGWNKGFQFLNTKMRRWLDQYGAAGLSITVLASTRGHALLGGAESGAQLGKAFDWYYHTYLRMPVNVAVDTAPIDRRLPPPDGRLFYDWSPLERAWINTTKSSPVDLSKYRGRPRGAVFAIIDRAGKTIWRATFRGAYDPNAALIDLLLHRVMSTNDSTSGRIQ